MGFPNPGGSQWGNGPKSDKAETVIRLVVGATILTGLLLALGSCLANQKILAPAVDPNDSMPAGREYGDLIPATVQGQNNLVISAPTMSPLPIIF